MKLKFNTLIKTLKNLFIVKIFNVFFHIPEEAKQNNTIYLKIATCFGIGYFKYAPGTFASLVAVILGMLLINFNHIVLFVIILVLLVLGFISSDKVVNQITNTTGSSNNDLSASKETAKDGKIDPQYIVIDEVVGQLIPFLLIGNNIFSSNIIIIALIFVLFRLLDIYKPWIIGKSETAFKGGIGVMIDDILAGVFTLFIVFIILLFK